jgi:transcriptional regulator with XRE-family HTH domain
MRKKDQKRKNSLLQGFGAAIRNRRIEQNMTQEELGEAAQLHRTYITDVESGLRNLSFLTMERLADALDSQLADLIAEAEATDI